MLSLRTSPALAGLLILLLGLTGCDLFGGGDDSDQQAVTVPASE